MVADVGAAVTVTLYGAARNDAIRAGELAMKRLGVAVTLVNVTTVEPIGTRFLFRAR